MKKLLITARPSLLACVDGKRISIGELAKKYNLSVYAVKYRMAHNISLDKPARKRHTYFYNGKPCTLAEAVKLTGLSDSGVQFVHSKGVDLATRKPLVTNKKGVKKIITNKKPSVAKSFVKVVETYDYDGFLASNEGKNALKSLLKTDTAFRNKVQSLMKTM